ncbi:PP2C family serine/threonine-protein phosphatase [Acinetobacter kyonggiensis]|uniref:Serine/threonine protein phosphatase PrpC n=1 Tax=Acinetobacter kyonggiensis TaxID=595670 RepID=A0A1H3KGE4_9GAMM|nr:PP2C family serine/threonine-protein phosphatase [Acinetobacter kyonggiensis]SDY50688.1 Serine/threonine protein phosphatase PrpC [Acinetobacter kyonggiensis]
MIEFKCKIKTLLEKNEIGLNDQFIRYISTDENLGQLSKLLQALRLNPKSGLGIGISQPEQKQNFAQKTAAAPLKLTEIEALETAIIEPVLQSNHDPVNTAEKISNLFLMPEESDKIQSAVVRLEDHRETEHPDLGQSIENKVDDMGTILQPHFNKTESVVDQVNIQDAIHIDTSTLNQNKNRAEMTDVFNNVFADEVKFQVENARVGQPYQSSIMVMSKHDPKQITFKSDSFKFAEHDFYFDDETQTVQGKPEIAEELIFSFQYCIKNETRTAKCKMNIIPDPRNLWKVLEPEAEQPFIKTHTEQKMIQTENYKLIAASRRGRSHEHAGTFRDDDFTIMHIPNSAWSVIAVADGAGSAQYSREGSRIAVEIVQSEFQRYLHDYTIDSLNEDIQKWRVGGQDEQTKVIANKLNQQFFHVYYEIYKSIITQIEQQAQDMGVAAKAFSTTLLIAVLCHQKDKTFMSTFSVGDGVIAAYSDALVRIMNVADGGEYAGQTKFLDRSIGQELGARIKIGCYSNIDAVMVMTDGISDPIFETEVGLANQQKWKDLYAQLVPLLHTENAASKLLEWMHFFTPGHHDDRTLAVLCNKNKAELLQ